MGPLLPFRNDGNRSGLCSKYSDMHGMNTCCHLANRLALPVKISVPKSMGDIALNLLLRK